MKLKALVLLVGILTAITCGNAYLSATNYYDFKAQVRREHMGFHQVTLQDCEDIEVLKGALRATLEQANKFTATSKVRSRAEKRAGDVVYKQILHRFQARHCQSTPKGSHAPNLPRKSQQKHRDKAVPRHL